MSLKDIFHTSDKSVQRCSEEYTEGMELYILGGLGWMDIFMGEWGGSGWVKVYSGWVGVGGDIFWVNGGRLTFFIGT